jgi:hypothetical protein
LVYDRGEVASPTKAQRARLDEKGAKSLLLKLKIEHAANKLPEIENKSDAWRAEMGASGAKIGKRGWERVDASASEPHSKTARISKSSEDRNGEGGDAFVS